MHVIWCNKWRDHTNINIYLLSLFFGRYNTYIYVSGSFGNNVFMDSISHIEKC